MRALCVPPRAAARSRLGLPGGLWWEPADCARLRRRPRCPRPGDARVPRTARPQSPGKSGPLLPPSQDGQARGASLRGGRGAARPWTSQFQRQRLPKPLPPSGTPPRPALCPLNCARGPHRHLRVTESRLGDFFRRHPSCWKREEVALEFSVSCIVCLAKFSPRDTEQSLRGIAGFSSPEQSEVSRAVGDHSGHAPSPAAWPESPVGNP